MRRDDLQAGGADDQFATLVGDALYVGIQCAVVADKTHPEL